MLKKFYQKQLFQPNILGIFTNPFFITRIKLFKEIKHNASFISGKILDVGCGNKPYQSLFNSTEYIGMDIEVSGHNHTNENIDIYYDGLTFPFEDNQFDSIICSQVLEHIASPKVTISEIHRVLKRGGYVLFTLPFLGEEHEQPYDFYRYTSFGIKNLLEINNFQVQKIVKLNCNISMIFAHFWNVFLYKYFKTKYPIISLLLTPLLHTPNTVIGYILSFLLPKTNDFYTDILVIAKKL
jgi:SAM-dependent methyltransferase